MASIGIQSGGKLSFPSVFSRTTSNRTFSSVPIRPIANEAKKIPNQRLSVSSNSALVCPSVGTVDKGDLNGKDGAFLGKIDSWMEDSVGEIVKNLKQAPLLVKVYSEKDGACEDGRVKIETEKAMLDRWPNVESQWSSGESRSPDGLIFVDELDEHPDEDCQGFGEGLTRAWGIVVQGKGVECPTCYLLKTNRVCGGVGLGFCTHFCLMRVNNLRDSALEQFTDSWLLQ